MSRPLTLEQSLLNEADRLLTDFSLLYERRLQVLEACASRTGGFDIDEYWKEFKIDVTDGEAVKSAAETLSTVLAETDIPASLAISSLAREPISVSEKKQHGAFYTDFRLAQFVAEDCQHYLEQNSRIADIAAGSGILLAAVAAQYFDMFPENYNQWISRCVYAFDLSENALRGARIAVAALSSSVKAIKKMCENWLVCDSLLSEHFPEYGFDIVVGNPPWGRVKLSLHSFVNGMEGNYHVYGTQYGDFDKERFIAKKQDALSYSKFLKERYPLLGDAEPDMYMAFLQKAISVLRAGGHLSYIVPAGLIRSLGTKSLRKFLINCSEDLKYYLLDNRANFFEIDTRFKFVVVSQKKALPEVAGCTGFGFEICTGDKSGVYGSEEIRFSTKELEKIRPDLTVPECRNKSEKALFVKIYKNGRSWKDEWHADIAREVDMTNDRPNFHEKLSETDIPVIEGRMIQQFRFGAKAYGYGSGRSAKWPPSVAAVKPQFFMSREVLSEQLHSRVNTLRAGYCDIAGQTNERSMMTAVIPPGVVCGNKVPTIIFPGGGGEDRLYFFVGVTNSFVFDWILRRVLSTTVNYFLLFSLPMPNIDLSGERAKRMISLAKRLSRMGAEYYTEDVMAKLRVELEVETAMAYGLDFDDLELIIKDFPLLDRRQPALHGETRSTYSRDLLLSAAEERFRKTDRHYTERADMGAKRNAKAFIPTEMTELTKGGTT